MAVIHWIHLSDVHYNKTGTQAKLMRQKLPSYIKALSDEDKIHYLFFTGDIRYAPYGEFPVDCVDFFDRIRDSAKVEKDNMFVVIGNHDVDREDTNRHDAINELVHSYYENDSVITKALCSRLKSGRDKYYNILQKIISDKTFIFHKDSCMLHFPVETEYVNILHLDSTLTYEEHRESEFIIGTFSLIEALESCNPKKPTVILSHYSLDSFAPAEQKAILRILKQYHAQLWLSGHKHTDIIHKDRDFFYVAHSGNMTFERQTSPGFVEGFLDTSTGTGKLRVHKWNESSDWALYQTLVDSTDLKEASCKDRTTYPFILDDWCKANSICIPAFSSCTETVKTFIRTYRGKTILLSTLQEQLGIQREDLLTSLSDLSDQGYVWLIDAEKSQWKILKE